MEVNGVGKAALVTKTAASNLDGFDAAVDALGRAVTDLEDDGIQNAP